MQVGYKLIAEAFSPKEIVRQGVRAEEVGFDFVEISDHYHPWLTGTPHSGFAWSMLAAFAASTDRIALATGVTCPTMRYHPAIVAQAAATTAVLSDGRFTLGLGSGERLNEHVIGAGWPSISARQEMLREAIEIIQLLWSGGYHSFTGKHLTLDDARVFDLPPQPPLLAVAAGGERAARLAGQVGAGLFVTEPRPELIAAYGAAGGRGPRYAEVPLSWATDVESAMRSAHEKFRFGITGWKIQAELPNPINFEAATAFISPETMAKTFACGPDLSRHLQVAQQFLDAGYDRLSLINAGPDPDGFFEFFASDLAPALRRLEPGGQA